MNIVVMNMSSALGFKAFSEIEMMPAHAWDRYSNPFEQKFFLEKDFYTTPSIQEVFDWMGLYARHEIETVMETHLVMDKQRHYHGVFRYAQGDHLGIHVDAGIHPLTKLRKAATALVYLGAGNDLMGDLEFWRGSNCASAQPFVFGDAPVMSIKPRHGLVVLFENHDYAWHGVSVNKSLRHRVVMTLSFLSDKIHMHNNMRERAYFVPRPDEQWDEATLALRDKRADPEKFSEAYRV